MKTTLQTVEEKVTQGNQWYTDDQHQNQLGTPGSRLALEGRWRLFGKAIDTWIQSEDAPPPSIKVLDAGCGDGINGAVLKRLFNQRAFNCEIVGCDYNSTRLSRAQSQGYERILQADLLQLPFEDNEFGLILCSHVLEHIPQDEACLRELKRVLKPNGLLILAMPNEGCLMAYIRNHFFQRSIIQTTDHVNFYTGKKLRLLVSKIDLEPMTEIMREGVFMPHLGINTLLREREWGREFLRIANRLFPSQAAGLVVGFVKS